MLALLVFVNAAISAFNAWACGQAWSETKQQGGWAHLVNWSGLIMSVCGFIWCYMIALGLVASLIPYGHDIDGNVVRLVTPERLLWLFELGYAAIIFPVLGFGIILLVNSWAHFYRERNLTSGAVAVWNTYAQLRNMYDAVQIMPSIWHDLGRLFSGSASSASGSGASSAGKGLNEKTFSLIVIIVILLMAIVLAILTTNKIFRASARSQARDQLDRLAT